MARHRNNSLHKAEALLSRVLQRLGEVVDKKLAADDQQGLSLAEIDRLTSLLEETIESNLGDNAVAPNHFKLQLTYEQRSRLGDRYVEALAEELRAAAHEFIANHRYRTIGPVILEVGCDVFSKGTAIKAELRAAGAQPTENTADGGAHSQTSVRVIELRGTGGQRHRFELKSGDAPSHIGRAAGSAVRLDDPSVSRLHCSVALRSDGGVVLADLGSANGTSINGLVVSHGEARPLEPGDTIKVGDVELRVMVVSDE